MSESQSEQSQPEWLQGITSDETLELTKNRMCADLIDAVLTEIQQQQRPWPQLSKSAQQDLIDRISNRCTHLVQEAIHLIAADQRPCLVASLESVTAKGGIKAVLKIAEHVPERYALLDSVSDQVLVILGGSDFTGAPPKTQAEADQRGLC
ncbi:MAG: hypothetical protein H6974_13005 [Gammaproteobacteria bacterium]|nr:hypothetical protein [Gammaproteobacteria bacterium]